MRNAWKSLVVLAVLVVPLEAYKLVPARAAPLPLVVMPPPIRSIAAQPVPQIVVETPKLTPLPNWGSPPINPAASVRSALLTVGPIGSGPAAMTANR